MHNKVKKLIDKWQSEDAEYSEKINYDRDLSPMEFKRYLNWQRRLRVCIHELILLYNSENENGGKKDGIK